jgi:hypothetical protein
MSPIMPRPIIAALLALGLVLCASPILAAGKLDIVQKFVTGKSELDVATYTDAPNKIGLLGIASSTRISMAFNRSDWGKLISLCNKAIKTNATTWVVVGTMSETETTDDVAQLTISAGPGVNVIITTPKRGTNSYVLQKKDYPLLQSALRKVEAYLSK